MNEEKIQNVLFNKAYAPVFLNKCAAAGIPVNTREDAEELLKIAAILSSLQEGGQVKSAAQAPNDIVKSASKSLAALVAGSSDDTYSLSGAILQDPEISDAFIAD
jgi:predicted transcriptional regulator